MAPAAPAWLLAALLLLAAPEALRLREREALATEHGRHLNFRVFLINLDRRQDRLHHVLERLQLAGEPQLLERACRLPAVDGTNETARQELLRQGLVDPELQAAFEQKLRAGQADHLTPGGMGSYASHWQALRHIGVDGSLDFGLILEDDLQYFSPDFPEQFAKLWRNDDGGARAFWQHADMVYLQQDGGGWQKGGRREERATRLENITGLWPKNLGMYAVSRDFARTLAGFPGLGNGNGRLAPMVAQLDSVLPGAFTQTWAFEPPIAQMLGQDEPGGDSDIELAGLQLASGAAPLRTLGTC